MTKLGTILDQIDSGTILLPEFQRGYVWNRDQVRGLMRSLYRGFPVGSLLVWETEADPGAVRGTAATVAGVKQLLLDGQQRLTSLYGVIRGKPPAFFQGDANAFTGLHFNIEEQTFEFYAPMKMKDDARWLDVTSLFVDGLEPHIQRLTQDETMRLSVGLYLTRLARLRELLEREFHADRITGSDKTVDIVVDIFNRVNSGGTKLSKGDLALAKLCSQWAPARTRLREYLKTWEGAGYNFSLDWLLRVINAVATGRAAFSAFDQIDSEKFQESMVASGKYVGGFLDVASGRLGLDHDRVFLGRYAVPVVARLLHEQGGHFTDAAQRDRALYWYVNAGLWGRFSGTTETVLAQDYETVTRDGVDGLIESLTRWRGGNLTIAPHDFEGFGIGSRFYPLLYLLTRVDGARDFGTGIELRAEMLGHLTSLQVHHIFPKALLYERAYSRAEVNSVGNFCFLTQDTNIQIGRREPEDYFAETEEKHPGALASQWIPMDPRLWRVGRYRDFLAERQRLLSAAANSFLGELLTGGVACAAAQLVPVVVGEEEDGDEQEVAVQRLVQRLRAEGCAQPSLDAEVVDPTSGSPVAVVDALWANGLQPGQGRPVALDLDPSPAEASRLRELGFDLFTVPDALLRSVVHRNEVAAGESEEMEAASAA